jgi:hypothetical protein
MAKLHIEFICGCGYHCADPEEAASHSDNRHHEMSINGYVKPTTSKAPRYGAQQHPAHDRKEEKIFNPKQPPEPTPIRANRDFDDIRAKLKR